MVAFVSALALLVGSLHGTVTRGPIMPVCRVDVPCDEPAANVRLFFQRAGRVTRVMTDRRGRYAVRLVPGSYAVRTNQRPFGEIPRPARVRVIAGRNRRVDFAIDTGIR